MSVAFLAVAAPVPAAPLEAAVEHGLELVALTIGVVGVVVIVWGCLRALWALLRIETATVLRGDTRGREELRNGLGYYLLLGLELLVAADIVETIHTPDLENLASLGAIVAIRTVISFSLNWELRQHEANIKN